MQQVLSFKDFRQDMLTRKFKSDSSQNESESHTSHRARTNAQHIIH